MILKKYFKGYYCVNKEEIETIGKNSNRIIIDILKDSYPNGLNANQIAEKTNMPIKTIYNQLQDLEKEYFIRSLGKQHNKRGRPSVKDSADLASERYRVSYIYEDMSRIYDHIVSEEIGDNYTLAPGNTDYSSEFLDVWHQIVEKEEEENICNTLMLFLQTIFSRINGQKNAEIKTWVPTISNTLENNSKKKQIKSEQNKDFCCVGCGINHEARDFFRAVLLHLIDHLEKNGNFINFMINNQLINKERYQEMIALKGKGFKEKDMKIDI